MRYYTYSQFQTAWLAKIGETNLTTTLANWGLSYFNERLPAAAKMAEWVDYNLFEPRQPNSSFYIPYAQGTSPQTGLPLNNIEYVWGIYGNSPYSNSAYPAQQNQSTNIEPMNFNLDSTGIYVAYPNVVTGENSPDGLTSTVWVDYMPEIPVYGGAQWVSGTVYQPTMVVWDSTTGDYYYCNQTTLSTGTPTLADTYTTAVNYWLNIDSVYNGQNFSVWTNTLAYAQGQIVSTGGHYYISTAPVPISTAINATYNVTLNYWKRLSIPTYLFNYLVHSCYALYLLTNKQNDKHKSEEQYAEQAYIWPEKKRWVNSQKQRPARQVYSNVVTQTR